MTDEPENQEEELLLTEEVAGDEAEVPVAEAANDQDEFAIEIEGEEPGEEETPLIRQLRDQVRDTQRELAQYRKVNTPKIEVGPEPDLWDDCEGDPEKYKKALLDWTDRKAQAEKAEQEAAKAVEVRNQEYQRRFTTYRAQVAQLPVQDFEVAEKAVISALPEDVQSAIVRYAKSPAKVVYALGKHPAKLNALAQMGDLGDVIVTITDLERNLKVVNKKKPPAPEAETVQSGSALPINNDKVAEKLLAEAQRTGDMTKYNRFMKQRRAA